MPNWAGRLDMQRRSRRNALLTTATLRRLRPAGVETRALCVRLDEPPVVVDLRDLEEQAAPSASARP